MSRVDPAGEIAPPSEGVAADAAFAETYRLYRDDVFRYLVVLVGDADESADLVSETFARALAAWRRGRLSLDQPLPWLLVVGRRLATDRWRRLRTATNLRGRLRSREQDVLRDDSRLWVNELISRLPQRQREVLALRYIRDLSDRQISEVMGLSESGVRSLAARAIDSLRKNPEVWRD